MISEGEFSYRLKGKLNHLYENGQLLYRYASCKPRDQLGAWLNHLLAINMPSNTAFSGDTYLMYREDFWQFNQIEEEKAKLLSMLGFYRQAQLALSSMILPAAFAWSEALVKSSSWVKKTPKQLSMDAFEQSYDYDRYWQLLYRDAPLETLFEADDFKSAISLIVEPLVTSRRDVIFNK